MRRLTNKSVLITGGTTGIGLATAKLFMKEGARVAIVGQNQERVTHASKILGTEALTLCANVASSQDMKNVAKRIKDKFGSIDVLFANAGIAKPMAFADVVDENIDDQFDVNFKGVVYSIQSMLPLLNNPSSVIITSTTMIEKGVAEIGRAHV